MPMASAAADSIRQACISVKKRSRNFRTPPRFCTRRASIFTCGASVDIRALEDGPSPLCGARADRWALFPAVSGWRCHWRHEYEYAALASVSLTVGDNDNGRGSLWN
jgi:hypothetical protein